MAESQVSHPALWATADKLRLARIARQEFLDRWLDGKLTGNTNDLDRIVADMEMEIATPAATSPVSGSRRLLIE